MDAFDSAYWSGLAMNAYVDDVYLDDLIQLNYRVIEQVRPYYGYASYVVDRFHHGTRIITGELTLNFKRDAYLFSLLEMIRQGTSKGQAKEEAKTKEPPKETNVAAALSAAGILLQGFAAGAPNALLTQTIVDGLSSPDSAAKFMAAYKKNRITESTVNRTKPLTSSRRGLFETSKTGFDLYITFGEKIKGSPQVLRFGQDGSYYGDGKIEQEPNLSGLPGTALIIKGVNLFSLDKAIGDDGRPLVETYAFQAKDIEIIKPRN